MKLNKYEFTRTASVSTVTDNIVDVVCATDTAVVRYDFFTDRIVNETLSFAPDAVDLARLNLGASVCNSHQTNDLNDVLGAVVKNSARVLGNSVVCQVRLSDRPEISGLVNDIRNGIIKNVSVGYRMLEHQTTENNSSNTLDVLVTRWQPHEISFVAVPADMNSQSNRSKENMNSKNKSDSNVTELRDKKSELAEIERKISIRKRCDAGDLSPEFADKLIRLNLTEEQSRELIVSEYERKHEQDDAQINRSYATSTCSNTVKNDRAADDFLSNKRSILEIARDYTNPHANYTRSQLVERALTTSDFKLLLSNIANKSLQNAYEEAPQTFRPIVRETTVVNFKENLAARLGDAPSLKRKAQGAQYEYGAIGEEGERFKILTYGRMLSLSREAIINDDLSAFMHVTALQGRSASILESDLFYDSFNSNPTMSDGKKYFSVEHNNLLKVAKPDLTIENLSKARKQLLMQKTVDNKYMNLQGKYLIVPPDLQTTAEQLVSTNLLAKQVSDINPFSGGLEVITDPRLEITNDQSWYIACSPGACESFLLAYLEGNSGAYLESQEVFNTDAIEYKCRLDVAVAPVDWRGIVKITK